MPAGNVSIQGRGAAVSYEEVVSLFIELREAAGQFNEREQFQRRFDGQVREYLHRPVLVRRLKDQSFKLPS